MIIGLPALLDVSKLASKISLKETSTDLALPCRVTSITITREWDVPSEPVDSNVHVHSRVVTKPLTISLELLVYESEHKEFLDNLATIESRENGLAFTDRSGEVYKDLYITSLAGTQEPGKQGVVTYTMELTQIRRVEAIRGTTEVKQPEKQPMVDKGTKTTAPQKAEDRNASGMFTDFFDDSVPGQPPKFKGWGKGLANFVGFSF